MNQIVTWRAKLTWQTTGGACWDRCLDKTPRFGQFEYHLLCKKNKLWKKQIQCEVWILFFLGTCVISSDPVYSITPDRALCQPEVFVGHHLLSVPCEPGLETVFSDDSVSVAFYI